MGHPIGRLLRVALLPLRGRSARMFALARGRALPTKTMHYEALAVILLLIGVTLPLTLIAVRARGGPERVNAHFAWCMCASGLSWFAWTYAPAHASAAPPSDRPIQVAHDGYVSSSSCKACHPGEYGTWHRSYHRTMTQAADVDTVLGPIDGVVVRARDQSFALERRGREVWVEMDDPAWTGAAGAAPRVSRQIVQTTGSHTEQFYWIASGKGRDLTILPIMYRLKDEQRWGSLDGCCIAEPGFVQDLADGRWNRVCNRCHATHTQPRIVDGEGADTRVAELGIACEACQATSSPIHASSRRRARIASGPTG
jgi:hypothetical protein